MLDVVSITVYNRHVLLNIGSSIAQHKPDFESLTADALFTDTASEPFVWTARPIRPRRRKRTLVSLRHHAFDLLFQQFCWLTFSHLKTNSVNCGCASHTNEKQGTAELFASQKPGCLQWFPTQPSSSRASPCIARTERKTSQGKAEVGAPVSISTTCGSFKRVNIHKAVGPDGIPGRVLRASAFQLAGVFTDIFNLSLSLFVVPFCFKKSTIMPIPKKNKITCLNDWRSVALSPIFSKCFEKLIRDYICCLPHWIRNNLHTAVTVPQTMLLPSPCTLLSPTWKIRTPM